MNSSQPRSSSNWLQRRLKSWGSLQHKGGIWYTLGYDPVEFNKLKFTEWLQWVSTNLVVSMKQEMENFWDYFRCVYQINRIQDLSNKACIGYNHGAICQKKWHTYLHPSGCRGVEELCLHCCILYMEAMGVLSGHPLINYPWIKAYTWSNIQFNDVLFRHNNFDSNFVS